MYQTRKLPQRVQMYKDGAVRLLLQPKIDLPWAMKRTDYYAESSSSSTHMAHRLSCYLISFSFFF